jgi:hypothetical protein
VKSSRDTEGPRETHPTSTTRRAIRSAQLIKATRTSAQETSDRHHVSRTHGERQLQKDLVQRLGAVRYPGCGRRGRIRCCLVSSWHISTLPWSGYRIRRKCEIRCRSRRYCSSRLLWMSYPKTQSPTVSRFDASCTPTMGSNCHDD